MNLGVKGLYCAMPPGTGLDEVFFHGLNYYISLGDLWN